LIWQKEGKLWLSLDRVDLWDDRPMPAIDPLTFKWITEQAKKGQYDTVQKMGDEPYEANPAPAKIPGAALEFDMIKFGKVIKNELDIKTALSTIEFESGVTFKSYIHASNQVGYFSFVNAGDVVPSITIPPYNTLEKGKTDNSVEGQGLERLGYLKGSIEKGKNFIRYHQPTWQGNYYEVLVQWTSVKNKIIGQWTITQNKKAILPAINLKLQALTSWDTHLAWWANYWNRSVVNIPIVFW